MIFVFAENDIAMTVTNANVDFIHDGTVKVKLNMKEVRSLAKTLNRYIDADDAIKALEDAHAKNISLENEDELMATAQKMSKTWVVSDRM